MDLISELVKQNLKVYLETNEDHKFKGNMTLCPLHDDHIESMSINQKEDGTWVWFCHACQKGGNIIHYVVKKHGLPKGESIEKLAKEFGLETSKKMKKVNPGTKGKLEIEREHIYRDEKGKPIHKKIKYKKNALGRSWDFWHMTKSGKWIPGLGRNKPIPYNLDKFGDYEKLVVTEGEKDADTVNEEGTSFLGTSAPFGKSSWPGSLTKYFKDKSVTVFLYDYGNEGDAKSHAVKLQATYPKMEIYIAKVPLEKSEADITDYLNMFNDASIYGLYAKQDKLKEVLKNAKRFKEEDKAKTQEPLELTINNDFLKAYFKTISSFTDAPRIFILFSGIGLLSGILNKFYFGYPRKTHLNLYILLFAPSTFCRKTVCLDMANDYLMEVNENLCLPESFTTEALFNILQKQNRGLINWRELNQVKEFQMAAEYNKGLPAFLTDIYDFKEIWKRWTKGEGEIIVREPVISILAAGVTNWFTENLKKIDFEGGLWTRFLFVPGPEEGREFRLPRKFILNEEIVEQLNKLNDLPPKEMDLSKIEPFIEEWGKKHMEQAKRLDSGILQAMFQRLEAMLLKLAAIFQLSHNQSTIIEPETFKEAIKVIEYLKRKLIVFFEEEIHFSKFNKNKARILKYLKRKGRILYIQLLRNTKMIAKELKLILYQLQDEGQIKWQSGWVEYIGQN